MTQWLYLILIVTAIQIICFTMPLRARPRYGTSTTTFTSLLCPARLFWPAGAWPRLKSPLAALQKFRPRWLKTGHAQKPPRARKAFRKNFDSDDHFDRPFLFMGMKRKRRNHEKQTNG